MKTFTTITNAKIKKLNEFINIYVKVMGSINSTGYVPNIHIFMLIVKAVIDGEITGVWFMNFNEAQFY